MTIKFTVTDAVRTYKLCASTWGKNFNDPEYGPEILFESLKDVDRDIVDKAVAYLLKTGREYGMPDQSDVCSRAEAMQRARDRVTEMGQPMCSLCARPANHANHDTTRGNFAHAFTASPPKRQNHDYTNAVAELRAAKRRVKTNVDTDSPAYHYVEEIKSDAAYGKR